MRDEWRREGSVASYRYKVPDFTDQPCLAAAERINAAYDKTLEDGQRTRDVGSRLGTEAFADAVIERFSSSASCRTGDGHFSYWPVIETMTVSSCNVGFSSRIRNPMRVTPDAVTVSFRMSFLPGI